MNVGQSFFAVLDTDPSGLDPMPDLESHSGPAPRLPNLFIDVDAPLVDDIVPLIKNTPGMDAKDASLRLTRRQLRQWPPYGEGPHRRGRLWWHGGSGGAARS
jgi:hypothetical protein